MDTVLPERACWRKFTQTMTDHVFRDEDRHVYLAIVNGERVPDEIRKNHGTARPGLDRLFSAGRIHFLDFFENAFLYVKALFN